MALAFYQGNDHQSFVIERSERQALLIHGFMGTPATLRPIATALARQGWTVRVPLLPGFGSDISQLEQTCWRDWVRTASDVWREIATQAEQTLLFGFSMGGALALHLAAEHSPDKLVLAAPFWRLHDPRVPILPLLQYAQRHVRPFGSLDLTNESIRERLERLLPEIDLADADMQRQVQEEFLIPTAAVYGLCKIGRLAYEKAPLVKSSALIVQGIHDLIVHAQDTRELVRYLGGPVRFHEVHADHTLLREENSAFPAVLRAIQDYLVEPEDAYVVS